MAGNTGTNTSSDLQAAVTFTAGSLIPQPLADALQASLKIEFPNSLNTEGRIDFLSTTAVNQIASQLTATAEFQGLLTNAINQPSFTLTLVPQIAASDDFNNAVDTAVSNSFGDEGNLQKVFTYITSATPLPILSQAIANNSQFQITNASALIASATYISDVNSRIVSASVPNKVFTSSGNLDPSKRVTFTFPTSDFPSGVNQPYLIAERFTGTADSAGFFEFSRTSTDITYEFPAGLSGQDITINYSITSN